MKNGWRVIDTHCHIYPEKIAERAVAHTDAFYGVRSAEDGTVATLLRENERCGIDLSAVCSVATTPHQVGSINRYIAGAVAASGGRLVGIGTLHPDSEDQERDVEEALALGMLGVKLHPDIQGFRLDDERCLRIAELCEGRLTLLLHTGDKRYDYSNPNRLIPLLEHCPDLQVVGAHFGGYSIWDEAVPQLRHYANFAVDCSSSFFGITNEQALRYIDAYGADRVLFGTDYPMWTPGDVMDRLFTLGLSDGEMEQIFHKNAERVFRIPALD